MLDPVSWPVALLLTVSRLGTVSFHIARYLTQAHSYTVSLLGFRLICHSRIATHFDASSIQTKKRIMRWRWNFSLEYVHKNAQKMICTLKTLDSFERKKDESSLTLNQFTTCTLPLGAALTSPKACPTGLSPTSVSPKTLLSSLQALK